MGLRWGNFAGTVTGYLRLGLAGVRLKNSSGNLAVRNAADSADAVVLPQHLATGTRNGKKIIRDDGTWVYPGFTDAAEEVYLTVANLNSWLSFPEILSYEDISVFGAVTISDSVGRLMIRNDTTLDRTFSTIHTTISGLGLTTERPGKVLTISNHELSVYDIIFAGTGIDSGLGTTGDYVHGIPHKGLFRISPGASITFVRAYIAQESTHRWSFLSASYSYANGSYPGLLRPEYEQVIAEIPSVAYLLDRANHTGQQPANSIASFSQAVIDAVRNDMRTGTTVSFTNGNASQTVTFTNANVSSGGRPPLAFAVRVLTASQDLELDYKVTVVSISDNVNFVFRVTASDPEGDSLTGIPLPQVLVSFLL